MIKDKYQSHENSRIDDYEEEKPYKDNIVDDLREKDVSQKANIGSTKETKKSLNLRPSTTSYYEPTKSSSTTKSQEDHDEKKIEKFNGGLFVKSASEISNAGSLDSIKLLNTICDLIWYKCHLLNRVFII